MRITVQRERNQSMMPTNPFDRRARPNPYALYQFMRTMEPVHRLANGAWMLTRFKDCEAVLEDQRWSHDADLILEPGRPETGFVDPTVRVLRRSIVFSDGPAHAARRAAIENAMRKSPMNFSERAESLARDLAKLMAGRSDGADLVRDLAGPLALVLISELLGIPHRDRAALQRSSHALVAGLDPLVSPVNVVAADSGASAMLEYMLDAIDGARTSGSPALIAGILGESPEARSWDVAADLTAVFVIGFETTAAYVGNSLLALLRHPDQFDRLKADTSLLKTCLAECARFDGPVHLTARGATEDLEIGGVRVASGEQVIAILGAANRDPEVFDRPDGLDIGRRIDRHLGFGAGAHACFAQPMAEAACESVLRVVMAELPALRLDGEPAWSDSVTIRSLSRLPVRLTA